MLKTPLKNNNANNGPLKMKNFGKIIWLTLVGFMVAILATQYLVLDRDPVSDSGENEPPKPQIKANVTTNQDNDEEYMVSIDIQNGFKLETHMSREHPIGICKQLTPQQYASLEIKPYSGDYEEYTRSLMSRQENGEIEGVKTTQNGLRYWEDKGWNPTPGVLIEGNTHREFFMEKGGKVITMLQYDYAGGVMDKEIEKILEGLIVIEDIWD